MASPTSFRREIRKEPTTGDRVIILPDFYSIPNHGSLHELQSAVEGNIISTFSDNGTSVTVTSPHTPLLFLEDSVESVADSSVYDRISAFGADERFSLSGLNASGLELLLRAMLSRSRELQGSASNGNSLRQIYPYITYDTNSGILIGRLLASRELAPRIQAEITNSGGYFADKERCMFCDIIREELRVSGESRLIGQDGYFVSFVPFAPETQYRVDIMPNQHTSQFVHLSSDQLRYLAVNLYCVLNGISLASSQNGKVDMINLAVHSAPKYTEKDIGRQRMLAQAGDFYHFHVEISTGTIPAKGDSYAIPSSGWVVVPGRPKHTAEMLRNAIAR